MICMRTKLIKYLRENRKIRSLLEERIDYDSLRLNDVIFLCQEGDQSAIEYLLKEYEPLIKKVSSKFFLDTQDREDTYQIASIGFWNAIESWDTERNEERGFATYATMTMKRKLTDALRSDDTGKTKINTTASYLDNPVAADGEGGELTLGDTISSKEASPEEQYIGIAGARELMKFMKETFSQTERDIIMKYIQGYKVSEISEETGMKYKSVENALSRAKVKLSAYLENRED